LCFDILADAYVMSDLTSEDADELIVRNLRIKNSTRAKYVFLRR
jgi:hypothetical protein